MAIRYCRDMTKREQAMQGNLLVLQELDHEDAAECFADRPSTACDSRTSKMRKAVKVDLDVMSRVRLG